MSVGVTQLISGRTTTGAGDWVKARNVTAPHTLHIHGSTTAGAGAAVVDIEVSNDGQNVAEVVGSASLVLGTTVVSDGFIVDANWAYYRAKVNSISGTGAAVTAILGG